MSESLVDSAIETAPYKSGSLAMIASAVDHALHFLPAQGPISTFVHHNTLHSFEHLPFEQAVIAGSRRFGCEPYLAEDRYRHELRLGRIDLHDIRQVLMDDLGDDADDLVASFGTRYMLRLAMLQMPLHAAPESEISWLLVESDLLRKFRSEIAPARREQFINETRRWVTRHIDRTADHAAKSEHLSSHKTPTGQPQNTQAHVIDEHIDKGQRRKLEGWSDSRWEATTLKLLWTVCLQGVEKTTYHRAQQNDNKRINHQLLALCGEDVDALVNDILIRFCGGYLDQGFADWELPDRELGFAKSFARLYLGRLNVCPDWMKSLRGELRQILDGPFDALTSIGSSLELLNVPASAVEEEVCNELLALRGWAGMIWQAEAHTPFLPHPIARGSLKEYLAIRLLLLRHAIAQAGKRHLGTRDITLIRAKLAKRDSPERGPSAKERTYVIFQLAQACGWTPEHLGDMSIPQWARLTREIESFGSLERRRIFHSAYERHFQVAALDALAHHSLARTREPQISKPDYLAVFCIDDREESFRRHLEEVDPRCVTASAAGFFAVAMYYKGADHAHYRALCPAILTPRHYVQEEPLFSAMDANQRRAQRRRQIGWFTHKVHANSRTLVGGWVTGVFGAVATLPMVARILAPRFTARVRESMGSLVKPPATELHIERTTPEPGPDPNALGYTVDEMANIVIRILQDIGRIDNLPPIVLFFGHGSSSLNNPHESAYNCGACSGGRGGPNARAFAMMANDPRVRRITASRGVVLPEEVRFVGAYHNTCNDAVEYYDLDLLPRTHRELFRRIEANVNETRARNAHERSRRFESAPLSQTPYEALLHVEQRAEDLSQARPEYNHATNAIVTVGRRVWTRGLFMDRRAFVTEYDPSVDDENATILTRILQAAIPVCAGISLEYYFSTVDNEGYGCGSKLPHNVASMVGVMTGAASDLRPGLSQQMVEIHEPLRILFVVETSPEKMTKIIEENPGIARLVKGQWVHLAVIDPTSGSIQRYVNGNYEPHVLESTELPEASSSIEWYRGQRDHLGFASIKEPQLASL